MLHLRKLLPVIFLLSFTCLPEAAALAQAPTIIVKPQPESPLLISLVRVLSDNPRAPSFEYSILNRGNKPIRAFTLRHDDGGLMGSTMTMLKYPLQPGQSHPAEYGGGISSEPVKVIEMSVDFIEFSNGAVWGPDTTQSADQLRGTRAGMGAERDRLVRVLTEGGKSAFIEALEADGDEPAPLPGHSTKWERGFRIGARQFRKRLQSVNRENGFTAAESELRALSDQFGK